MPSTLPDRAPSQRLSSPGVITRQSLADRESKQDTQSFGCDDTLQPWIFTSDALTIPGFSSSESETDQQSVPVQKRGWESGSAPEREEDGEWYYHSGKRWWCYVRTTVLHPIYKTSTVSEVWKYQDANTTTTKCSRRKPNVERGE